MGVAVSRTYAIETLPRNKLDGSYRIGIHSMRHWMFKCEEVTKKVSESLDRKLPLYQRIFIRMHLLMCKYCTRFRDQLLILREASRLEDLAGEAVDPTFALSLEARTRIKESLKTQR